eukprot:TRINITY_DN1255_c1_g1_i1.p1 TRINITY_DN1255_c1_g1~~TRINITY_DN1255_c1_g1_i1.p1  ORF type:complete len:156 (-),score=23.89 TRINITY_DN1255_c1_g1_i1:56-523(-)
MLLIEHTISHSPLDGIGLFANQFIPKGTVIWVFHKNFDGLYTAEDFKKLSPVAKKHVEKYAYISGPLGGKYVLCNDHAKFFNHSENANTSSGYEMTDEIRKQLSEEEWEGVLIEEGWTYANRDIQVGEEITSNYLTDFPDKPGQSVGSCATFLNH